MQLKALSKYFTVLDVLERRMAKGDFLFGKNKAPAVECVQMLVASLRPALYTAGVPWCSNRNGPLISAVVR
jgi:hypothetical protein